MAMTMLSLKSCPALPQLLMKHLSTCCCFGGPVLLACSACSLGYLINTEMVSYQDSPHSFDQLLLYHKEKKKKHYKHYT